MRVLIGLGLATLMLTGCGDTQTEPAEAPVAAALPPGRPAIYEAAVQGPEHFVRAVYAAYGAGAVDEAPPGRDPMLGRTLNAAIGADAQKGARAILTQDPVCACTPGQAVMLKSVTVVQADAANAVADVTLTVEGQDRRQTLKLLKEGPAWRVADITPEGGGSVLDRLVASLS